MIKKFNDFNKIDEDVELAQPMVKPATPVTKPSTKPGRPSPYRKDRPSVVPKPKASAEDLSDKFLKLTKNDKGVKSFLKEKYFKKESVNESQNKLKNLDEYPYTFKDLYDFNNELQIIRSKKNKNDIIIKAISGNESITMTLNLDDLKDNLNQL